MAGLSQKIAVGFLLLVLLWSCSRNSAPHRIVSPPANSDLSILEETSDLTSLAKPLPVGTKAQMFSSAADTRKVMLAHLAPEIIGDMDYGFFPQVETNRESVTAILAEMDGPGMITWVWSESGRHD